uniref:Beta-fructofuranosidase, insoluble isoenzyme CWINV3 n=1 Tax=Litchi chinensis TaxID=151069 RepID=A0A248XBI8_LITCN|nr:beta-fructofuranosidase, insoluble isoenzyme CWINV3 [Litchi chinensis]
MANRSTFSLFLLFSLLLGHGVTELQASHHVYQHLQSTSETKSSPPSQPYRTGYHFQPPKNWINDPNGPMIYKGIYHLFYQYNPKGAVWGNIVWAHSTSTDLINWTPHPHAIYPSQPSDHYGCWSGSATILPGDKPIILYTGIIDPENTQVQNLAVPKNLSDPYLREWVKYPQNPLMEPTIENEINGSSFRDPTTAWLGHDNIWRVIIGSKIHRKGLAVLYRSRDFKKWTKAKHPLHSAKDTGMWECPDFFPVSTSGQNGVDASTFGPNVKHVLKASLDDTKHEYYTIGTYNITLDRYFPDKGSVDSDSGLRYDYGKYYASKTFFDHEKNRRILLGWINESSSVADDIKKGWAGVQAIPRKIWLDKSRKQLVQWPIVELEKQRENHVQLPSQFLKGGSRIEVSGVTPVQADVEISFEIPDLKKAEVFNPSWTDPQLLCSQKGASVKSALGPFGLLALASKDLQEYTAIFFKIFKGKDKYVVLMCSDQSRSSLNDDNDKTTYGAFLNVDPVHEKLSLRSLIDHSIVESFGGGGKACIAARVYPTLAIDKNAHLYAFNYGTEKVKILNLNAWSMKKAHIFESVIEDLK